MSVAGDRAPLGAGAVPEVPCVAPTAPDGGGAGAGEGLVGGGCVPPTGVGAGLGVPLEAGLVFPEMLVVLRPLVEPDGEEVGKGFEK